MKAFWFSNKPSVFYAPLMWSEARKFTWFRSLTVSCRQGFVRTDINFLMVKFFKKIGQFAGALALAALLLPLNAQTLPGALSKASVLPPDIETAVKNIPRADVAATDAKGIPSFLTGELARIGPKGKRVTAADLLPALEKASAAHRLKSNDLKIERLIVDELGFTHARYTQTKNGLEVVGARLDLHVDAEGLVYAAAGNARDGEVLPSLATITGTTAVSVARALKRHPALKPSNQRLVYVISTKDQSMHLAHEIDVQSATDALPLHDLVYVDAVTGEVVDVHALIFNDNVVTQFEGNGSGIGTVTNAPTDPNNSFYSTYNITGIYKTNLVNLALTYSFYTGAFGRNAYDAAGGEIWSQVNVGGGNTNNAFMDPASNPKPLLAFGIGDQTQYANFGLALDITAHEYTHAVTYKSSGLIYANEPGALNEAISDILGTAAKVYPSNNITASTWKLGSAICLTGAPHDAIRYMDNPTADGQSKDFYPNRYTLTAAQIPSAANDAGYVHLNSGIANLAFKQLVTGGMHPRAGQYANGSIPTTNVPQLTGNNTDPMTNARRVFYRANDVYLTPGAQFMDARAATERAALDLGLSTSTVNIAWDVVGVPAQTNRRPINISTRALAGTGANALIAGFVLGGGGSAKNMLIRGIGPTLGNFGISGALPDPQLVLSAGSSQIASNDDWSSASNKTAISQTAASVGAFALPDPSKDSSMIANLGNGSYSALVSDVGGQSGIALIEVYDTDVNNSNHLINISSRVQVTPSANLIAGFVVNGSGTKYLLIRAVGPGLSAFGVSGVLPRPKIQLFSGSTQLRTNSNWTVDELGNSQKDSIAQVGSKVGAFALNQSNADAALLVALPAGAYSAVVSDVNNTSGVALIEVYEVN